MTTSIAPLVTSQSLQLTGLTADTPARTRTTDVRRNVTESWTEQADGVTTTKRRVPEATNIISSRSRYGVTLESVSVSAVTNRTVYDALGRVYMSIDGRGNATRTEYDPFGRRSATIDPIGARTSYAYDRFGNLAAVTNALGNAIVYEYDLRGRKTYEGGATYPVRYTYDVFGNKVTMMTYRDESKGRESGDVTTWLYDEASGVMTNKVYADGKGPRYDYDANGRLVKRTWARGIDTFYAYDGWGNLTNTTYSDDTPTVALWYDTLGRQVETHDAAGVTTFAYDAFGANTNETVVGVAGTNVLERFNDTYGRDGGYALNGERQSTLGYDRQTGRIETMQAAGCTNAFRWSYHSGCDLKHMLRYPNGALVTWEYEPHRDLMTLVSNDVYSTFLYTYDEAGKRITKNDERYTYNVRGELILATNIVTGAEFAYRYDDIGNRLWSREFGTNCTYVANELNQYTNIVRGSVFELSAFDLDGDQTNVVTSTGVWAVEYNAENQPKVWKSSQINVSLAYDWRGRRILKGIVFSVYDDFLDISEMIWDPTERYATRPLCFQRNGLGGYLLHDGNKNVVAIINSSDSSVSLIEYSPVGAVVSALDFGVHCLFSSEIYDVELGMSSYSTRYYNSYAARWSVRDFAGETAGVNLYALLGNDSVGLTDYLGYSKTGGARAQCERAGGNFINEKCCCEKDVFDPANSCCLDLVLGKQTYSRDGEVAAVRHSWHFSPDDFMFKRYNMEDHVWLTWLGKSVDSNGFGNGVVGSPAQTFSNANSNGRSNGDQEIKLSWCEYDVFAFLSCLTSTAEEDAKSKKHGGLCNVYVDGLIDKCKKTAKRPNPL